MSKKKRCPRLFRLRTRPRKIRKNRRSKKPFRKSAIASLVVVIRITNNNLFNIFHKSFRENHKNSNLFVQKREVKDYYLSLIKNQRKTAVRFDSYFDENSINHITRILREIARTNKIPEGLTNNLSYLKVTVTLPYVPSMFLVEHPMMPRPILILVMPAFPKQDLGDRTFSLSESQGFDLTNQCPILKLVITFLLSPDLLFIPNSTLLSRRKLEVEEYGYDVLQTSPYFEKNCYDNLGDDQKLKADNGKPKIQEQEDDSLYRHIRELASCYSPEEQQAFKYGLWDSYDLNLGRESWMSLPGGSQHFY